MTALAHLEQASGFDSLRASQQIFSYVGSSWVKPVLCKDKFVLLKYSKEPSQWAPKTHVKTDG